MILTAVIAKGVEFKDLEIKTKRRPEREDDSMYSGWLAEALVIFQPTEENRQRTKRKPRKTPGETFKKKKKKKKTGTSRETLGIDQKVKWLGPAAKSSCKSISYLIRLEAVNEKKKSSINHKTFTYPFHLELKSWFLLNFQMRNQKFNRSRK